VAEIDVKSATMKDYAVYSASNQTGVGTEWGLEYRYSTTYKEPDFSAASVKKLTDGFLADKAGSAPASMAYQKYFFVGDPGVSANAKAAAMRIVWPTYACSMTAMGEKAFRSCACAARVD
jgi:sphingomyelin phosphodiesterase acid-like 3